jgi:hypothetical protein
MPPDTNADVTLSREELYEQVWSEPMWTLAARFGLSDVGMAKTCRRLMIPVPPRGYWQQKQAGQPVRPTKLPKVPTNLGTKVAQVTFRSPASRKTERELRAEGVQLRGEVHHILVPEILADPHPLIAHTVKALRRVKPTTEGLLPRTDAAEYVDVRVSLGTVDRAMLVLDTLFKALDEQGYSISIDIRQQVAVTRADILDEHVPFHLEERVERVQVPLPPPKRPDIWSPRVETRTVCTGALAFHIDATWYHFEASVRKSWRDGKKQRVEDCLGDIVAGLIATARALKADRAAREEAARQREEEERREKYRRWEVREEKRRRDSLNEELERWRTCEELRSYVEMRRTRGYPEDTDSERWNAWLAWIADYADRIERRLLSRLGPDPEPFDENSFYY